MFISTPVINLRRMGIFIIILLTFMTVLPGVSRGSLQIQNQNLPSGYPGAKYVNAIGNSLIPFIRESSIFKQLAAGTDYRVQDSSFGYTWGVGITPTERVILYSPDGRSYIVNEIDPSNHMIKNIYKGYSPQTAVLTNINSEPNYGGFNAYYCSGTGWFFGTFCNGQSSNIAAQGNIQIPNTISEPTGDDACCQFAEWTGVSDSGSQSGQNANVLIQGGVTWCGSWSCGLTSMPSGFNLVTEKTSATGTGEVGPTYFTPPSWMNGVSGQTIKMTTQIVTDYCAPGGAVSYLWDQFWQIGSSSTSQTIYCDNLTQYAITYGWYIFESPGDCGTLPGSYDGYCEIPQFSYNGNPLAFSGYICGQYNDCPRPINTNYDQVNGYYIQHRNVDTGTSQIGSDGASWTEWYTNWS